MARSRGDGSALLLAEEYFGREDDRFVDAIRQCGQPQRLAGFVNRWRKDPRPWARAQVLAYLDQPLEAPGHEVVVKRLFKHAEDAGDDGLMAAFLVAFDRLVRRQRKTHRKYDWTAREIQQEEYLDSPRNKIPHQTKFQARNPRTGETFTIRPSGIAPAGGQLFSYHTRHYLRRRAWRYFRRMGHQRPGDYVPAAVRALRLYRDQDLAAGENILDSWGLLHLCFAHDVTLQFHATTVTIAEGHRLSELQGGPAFAQHWRRPEACAALLDLVADAPARLVRVWALYCLRKEHADHLAEVDPQRLLPLFDHEDAEVQRFAAEILGKIQGLEKLPLETWLRLTKTSNPEALYTICELIAKHVSAERLELAHCIELACAAPVPLARLGLTFLKSRAITTGEDREAIAAVSQARCAALGVEIASWALGIVGANDNYDTDLVCRFFDSLTAEVRQGAWSWLTPESTGYSDPALWSRLIETPYDDVRMQLIDVLEKRSAIPGVSASDLTPLWCAVLLGVSRGGRQKRKALRQISEALVHSPARLEELLPVLAVALRSVRLTETDAALAAIVMVLEHRPELEATVRRYLPELVIAPGGSGA